MRLIQPDAYRMIFAPLDGQRVGYIRNRHGNAGDAMQDRAVRQLAEHYGVRLYDIPASGGKPERCDAILCYGGGNMGLPGPSMRKRGWAVATGLRVVCLPNSWRAPEYSEGVCYYARESASLRYCPSAQLAPDMGLGMEFDGECDAKPRHSTGVFLRNDREGLFANACRSNRGAPFALVGQDDVDGYLTLAASFERVVTDALHFAVAALMVGREAVLVPGAYHKQRGMYDSWLKALGCRWADSPMDVEGVS